MEQTETLEVLQNQNTKNWNGSNTWRRFRTELFRAAEKGSSMIDNVVYVKAYLNTEVVFARTASDMIFYMI